jgi:hypothetical protein
MGNSSNGSLLCHLENSTMLEVDEERGCIFSLVWAPQGNLLASTSGVSLCESSSQYSQERTNLGSRQKEAYERNKRTH